MSSITSLISGGGGGTPVNSIAQLFVGDAVEYTDESGGAWLKTGNLIASDPATYPDAYISDAINTPLFTNSFSVAAQEGDPRGIAFNTDGTKMFVVGDVSDNVNEYALSTRFNVSTASFTQLFSVAAQETKPQDIAFNSDGTKMFIVGTSGDDVNEYALGTGFDVSTASFTRLFSVASQETVPNGIAFNNDGTKMFIVGQAGDDVNEYALSTAFNISTTSFTTNFSVSAQQTDPQGITFNNDGTKMFIVGSSGFSGQEVNEYALSTGFDVSTASFTQLFSVAAQEGFPMGIAFNTDGTKMFITGSAGDDVNEYVLVSPFTFGEFAYMGLIEDTGTYDYLKIK